MYKIVKINENFCTLDVLVIRILQKNSNSLNVQIRQNSMKNRRTYQIIKIQGKIMYIRCTNTPNLLTNLFSLKVQNCEKVNGKLCTLDAQIIRICKKIRIR